MEIALNVLWESIAQVELSVHPVQVIATQPLQAQQKSISALAMLDIMDLMVKIAFNALWEVFAQVEQSVYLVQVAATRLHQVQRESINALAM